MSAPSIRVALLGCGTVGREVAAALLDPQRSATLAEAAGARLELVGVAVARPEVARPGIDPALLTGDAASLVREGGADVVIELIGGIEGAEPLVRLAMESRSSVVTANKALLASRLGALTAHASQCGVDLLYEAAVAGAVPVVRVLRTSLAGQPLSRVLGIVNGTTNFILTTMSRDGRDYHDVLAEAMARGYAERDPSADVDGHDAAQKAAILASLAFGREVTDADVPREGISRVTAHDIQAASRMGHVVRLLAVAERVGGSAISVRVHPSMVPIDHPLAAVDGATNAVFVDAVDAGPLMFLGAGAGGRPTASAVLGDLLVASRNRLSGAVERGPGLSTELRILPHGELQSAFYLAVEVADRPGVLAAVATVFGLHGVSIRSMEQIGLHDDARLVFLTHRASETDMAGTVSDLAALDTVKELGALLRVVEGDDA